MDDTRQLILAGQKQRLRDGGPRLPRGTRARFRRTGREFEIGFVEATGKRQLRSVVRTVSAYALAAGLQEHWWVFDTDGALGRTLEAASHECRETQLFLCRQGPAEPGPAIAVDIHAVSDLHGATDYERVNRLAFGDDAADEGAIRERARSRWEDIMFKRNAYFVAYVDGSPVGGAYLSRWEPMSQILGLGVVPERRRQGYARALVGRAIDEARQSGEESVYLIVTAGSDAESLYRGLGFEEVLSRQIFVSRS